MSDCKVSDQVYNAFNEMESNLVESIQDAITEEVLPPDFQDRMGTLMEYTMSQDQFQEYAEETDKYKWRSLHRPAMQKMSEGYTNLKEGMDNMDNIPVIESIREAANARHNTFKGSISFTDECRLNGETTSAAIKTKEEEDLKTLKDFFSSNLDSYKELYNYRVTIGGLIDAKMKELEKISNKVDTYKQNLFIDSRKDNYENSNYDFYKSIYFYVVLIYYVLLICYFIFTPFFQEKKYLNYKLVIIIVLYIFIPFLLPYLLSIIYNIYEYILETNNLRGDIISYPHIIEDKEKYE
tara:strand:- start:1772 stop:2656 length:885 start_codon:yes stop_codon:yes gene_type:complete